MEKNSSSLAPWIMGILISMGLLYYCCPSGKETKTFDYQKASEFTEKVINSTGFKGCKCESLGNGIACDLRFPVGTDNIIVELNTKKAAELMGQMGIGSSIFFTGYAGKLRVCKYKWDIYSQTITKQ